MGIDQQSIKLERAAIRRIYGVLFDRISAILFDADPNRINYETNTDEYEPEVGTILPRLREANTAADVERIVYEEFVRWFGAEEARSQEGYQNVSARIWEAWCSFKNRTM